MRFETHTDDLHTATDHIGPVRFLTLPFAVAGLVPLAGALGLVEFTSENGEPASPIFLLLFSLPFLAAGFVPLLWRKRILVDLANGTVQKKNGVLSIGTTRTRPGEDFSAARYDRHRVRTDKGSHIVYRVVLEAERGGDFDLAHYRRETAARRVAEWLAKLLHFDVIDDTGDEPYRRPFAELDWSLRERRARTGHHREPSPMPNKMRSVLQAEPSRLTIDIPAFGLQPLVVIGLLFVTGPIWMVMIFLTAAASSSTDPASDNDAWFAYAAYGIAAIPTVSLMTIILVNALRRFHIDATPDELQVQELGLRPRTSTIPAEQLEELSVVQQPHRMDTMLGGGPAIRATSDAGIVQFGQTLPAKETAYLAELMHDLLSRS